MHTINLQAVSEADVPAVLRMAALKLLKTPYLDVGTFLTELKQCDLDELVAYCNAITMKVDVPPMLEVLVILGEMLAQAEGTPLDGPDATRTSNLMILLTFEDLARKGIVEFHREHATLFGALTNIQGLARLKD